ncbi:inositol monophosphatase family protein [Pseudonocardia sp. CA-142604]|uniref:inositol monophosphatase family protein n=1 Tax=Pseudonocardia sp. CA-142604 TaxID=3240024 RepID=UPI003D941186
MRWVSEERGTVRIIGTWPLPLAHAGLGRAAATVLPGRYNSWDVAAGVVIATEGGCQLFDAQGPTTELPADGLPVAGRKVADAVWHAWRRSIQQSAMLGRIDHARDRESVFGLRGNDISRDPDVGQTATQFYLPRLATARTRRGGADPCWRSSPLSTPPSGAG